MATGSLLALIDDIASVLDDISVLTKAATKKTAGVLGDDLALNAQQVSGVAADRELPVVWAVAKGSLLNKAILVPLALAISAFVPWAVTPLLMVGGTYLCYEGFEKLAHRFLHGRDDAAARKAERARIAAASPQDLVALERAKVKGAIRTDFVLSAEIIAITLGTVAGAGFVTQLTVLAGIGLIMTIGVYGIVAGIVKLDDAGLHLSRAQGALAWQRFQRAMGRGILAAAPWLMKALSVAGTVAMFLVGGGILTHGLAPLHHGIERLVQRTEEWGGAALAQLAPLLADALVGVVAGAVALVAVSAFGRLRRASAG
jgi:predicted DNA repair protein MutK